MATRILINLLLLILLLSACSENNPTESGEPGEGSEAVATIGPEGGSLTGPDFQLVVPSGTFNASVTLTLYSVTGDQPAESGAVSKIYRLEGLPENFVQALPIRIKWRDSLVNNSYIAVGGDCLDPLDGDSIRTYRMIEAVDSAGYLCAALPPDTGAVTGKRNNAKKNQASPLAVYFMGKTGYDAPVSTAHFRFIFPTNLESGIKQSLQWIPEQAIDSLLKLGFNLDMVPLPIDVYMYDYEPQGDARRCMFFPAWGAYSLVYDEASVRDLFSYNLVMYAVTMRECAHALFSTYDNRYFNVLLFRKSRVNPERFWLHHACASWSEQQLVGQYPIYEFFEPLDFTGNEKKPFNGMLAGMGTTMVSARNHGGGLSSLIKYLAVNYNESVVWRIYDGIKNHSLGPVDAVCNSVADAPNIWWPDFIKEYVRKEIYGGPFDGDAWPDDFHGSFTVNSPDDTLAEFTWNYPDLSARMYLIELDYSSIDTIKLKATAPFVPSDDIDILVYGHKDGVSDPFLRQGGKEIVISHVDTLIADGYTQLWVVLVNSKMTEPDYDGLSDIELRIDVSMSREWWVQFWFDVYTERFYNNLSDDSMRWEQFAWPNWEPVHGQLSDNVFTAVWDTTDMWDDPYYGNMQITFNSTMDTITSFYATAIMHNGVVSYREITIAGSNIPLYRKDNEDMIFDLRGMTVCNHFSQFEYTWQAFDDSWWDMVTQLLCHDSNYVTVSFWLKE